MRSAFFAVLVTLALSVAACSKTDAQCSAASCMDAGAALAEIGDPCTGNATCASGLCDLGYPFGLCYAACRSDGDCGDVTMKLCGADGRCYLACKTNVDCEPGAATCQADVPARADGRMLCDGMPKPPDDAGANDSGDAPAGEASPADAPADSSD